MEITVTHEMQDIYNRHFHIANGLREVILLRFPRISYKKTDGVLSILCTYGV